MKLMRDRLDARDGKEEIFIETNENMNIMDLPRFLLNNKFFPNLSADGIWGIYLNDEEIGLVEPKIHRYSIGSVAWSKTMKEDFILYFRYFHDYESRAEYLFKRYQGDKQEIYYAGFGNEYLSYQIQEETEQKWVNELESEDEYHGDNTSVNLKESFDFLQMILRRPGMYVGTNRMDYIKIFFDGWRTNQKSMWNIEYDLQKWLFIRESISYTGNINAISLFFEYFGLKDDAIQKFREFMEETEVTSCMSLVSLASITDQLSSLSSFSKDVPKKDFGLDQYLDYKNKSGNIAQKKEKEILRQIKRLLPKEEKRIRIYINCRSVFLQVRFFFEQDGSWIDGTTLQDEHDYLKKLIVLHSYIHKAYKMLENCVITLIYDNDKITTEITPYETWELDFTYEQLLKENLLMNRQFEQWKGFIVPGV